MSSKTAKSVWQQKTIEEEKRQVKDFLDSNQDPQKPETRYKLIVDKVQELESDTSALGNLRRYIYAVSGLVHHMRFGGLPRAQIDALMELASAILKAQRIGTTDSTLGYLHGDLNHLKSQLHRLEGKHWEAAWEHELSNYLSRKNLEKKKGHPELGEAIRAMRIGHIENAIALIETAEKKGLEDRSLVRGRIETLKGLRLLGRHEEAESVSTATRKLSTLNDHEQLEIFWEGLCRGTQQSNDLSKMLKVCLPGKSHQQEEYLLEFFLWSRAVKSREWMTRFPSLKKLTQGIKLNRKKNGFWLKSVKVLESCYDSGIPFAIRLEALGDALTDSNKHFSLDKELLFWAAAVRWLSRNRSEGFASLVFDEYQTKCARITLGKSLDVLGVLGDLAKSGSSGKKAA